MKENRGELTYSGTPWQASSAWHRTKPPHSEITSYSLLEVPKKGKGKELRELFSFETRAPCASPQAYEHMPGERCKQYSLISSNENLPPPPFSPLKKIFFKKANQGGEQV